MTSIPYQAVLKFDSKILAETCGDLCSKAALDGGGCSIPEFLGDEGFAGCYGVWDPEADCHHISLLADLVLTDGLELQKDSVCQHAGRTFLSGAQHSGDGRLTLYTYGNSPEGFLRALETASGGKAVLESLEEEEQA